MLVPETVADALNSTRGLSSWLVEATKDNRKLVKSSLDKIMAKAEELNTGNRPGFQAQCYRPRAAPDLWYEHETDCISTAASAKYEWGDYAIIFGHNPW